MLRSVEELILVGEGAPDGDEMARAAMVADGVEFGRVLSNRSANDLYPERMADVARELTAEGCAVEVLGVEEMRALGMGALLVLLGTFSGILAGLPKSGRWLLLVKRGFAVLLLLAGEYFLVQAGRLLV